MVQQKFAHKKEIWILEDDETCIHLYRQILDLRYKTRYFEKIKQFQQELTNMTPEDAIPSLVIADLLLSDGNFLDFLSEDGHHKMIDIPFIVVSSIDDIDALRFCFNEGALDYLTKPFKKNEILVKVENKLKGNTGRGIFTHEDVSSLMVDGKKIKNLTGKEMQLLALFLNSLDRTVQREEILEKAWGGTTVHPKTVDVHLYNLRRKIFPYGFIIKSEGRGRWTLCEKGEGDGDLLGNHTSDGLA